MGNNDITPTTISDQAETGTVDSSEQSNIPAQYHDTAKLLKLRLENGLSYGQIAELTGIPKPTIYSRLAKFEKLIGLPDDISAYADARVKILKGIELQLLGDLVDDDKRKKASLNNVAYAFGQIHNARRLEEGLNTGNETTIEVALNLIRSRRSGGKSEESGVIDVTPQADNGTK